MAAEHIEMTSAIVIRDEMDPRLQDNAPVTMRPYSILDSCDNFSVRDVERVYIWSRQETKPQSSGSPIRQTLTTRG